jgi:hypothetical protein
MADTGQVALFDPPGAPPMLRDAVLSDDEVYRYFLTRRWDQDLPVMPWVALNPSKADREVDDPSVLKMCWFARREGYGGISLSNMYGLRATNPAELRRHPDPVGPDNDRWLARVDGPVVVAWGAHGAHPQHRARRALVTGILAGLDLRCLGVTRDGEPRHPCRLAYDTPLTSWEP